MKKYFLATFITLSTASYASNPDIPALEDAKTYLANICIDEYQILKFYGPPQELATRNTSSSYYFDGYIGPQRLAFVPHPRELLETKIRSLGENIKNCRYSLYRVRGVPTSWTGPGYGLEDQHVFYLFDIQPAK